VISSDDEEDSEDVETTPAPRKSRARVRQDLLVNIYIPSLTLSSVKTRKEEAMIDADIDDLLDHDEGPSVEIPHDSIMDDSDEEDEVNDLLAAD
jgi:hypothetical protein